MGLSFFFGGHLFVLLYQLLVQGSVYFLFHLYSFLSHKEFRFIFPVLPLAMCYCGLFLSSLCDCQLRKNQEAHHQLLSGMKAKLLVLFLAVTNVPMALYTSTVHQRGSIDVMSYIHDESLKPTSDDGMSVLFLMPCHSTPFFRYSDCLIYIEMLPNFSCFHEGSGDKYKGSHLSLLCWLLFFLIW